MNQKDTSTYSTLRYEPWLHAPRVPFLLYPAYPPVTVGHLPLVVGPGQQPLNLG